MKIVEVRLHEVKSPTLSPVADATAKWDSWNGLIIELVSDDGLRGYGEIGPVSRKDVKAYSELFRCRVNEVLIGENPFNREEVWERIVGRGSSSYSLGFKGFVVSAAGGVDLALWDLIGKALGKPLYELLGGLRRSKVKLYASGLFLREGVGRRELVREALSYVESGFKSIKMKLEGSLEKDFERVKLIRDAVGYGVELMVDANQGYSFREALKMARFLEKMEVSWFEEPIPVYNLSNLAKLADKVDIPIAIGENQYTCWEFREIIEEGAADIIQPDLIHVGGITECLRVSALARAWNIPCIPHIHGVLALAASIHLSIPKLIEEPLEYISGPASWEMKERVVAEQFKIRGGFAESIEKPGLGVNPLL